MLVENYMAATMIKQQSVMSALMRSDSNYFLRSLFRVGKCHPRLRGVDLCTIGGPLKATFSQSGNVRVVIMRATIKFK